MAVNCLVEKMNAFQAGRIKDNIDEWCTLTTDHQILQLIQGTLIDFSCDSVQHRTSHSISFSQEEMTAIDKEIISLLHKKVIVETFHEPGEVVSSIFTREKQDGTFRVILNLKNLNKSLVYKKFKMETLKSALTLLTPGCFMASIDLVSAYYSVPIAEEHQKFLKFKWRDKLFKFTCYPNGLAQAPRNFTKITKPIYSHLHSLGHVSSSYLDDSLLVGNTEEECEKNVADTVSLFTRLGFVVHPHKSSFKPAQRIVYLGFEIDSVTMTISLSQERKERVENFCRAFSRKSTHPIREVARLIGVLVSCFPAVPLGPAHYRDLEREKVRALKITRGNWDSEMRVSETAVTEVKWWCRHGLSSVSPISRPDPDLVIFSDASLYAWGGVCGTEKTGGAWTEKEKKLHINELELLAAFLALKSFSKGFANAHIRIFVDNTTTMACLNKMGSSKSLSLDNLSKQVWSWCENRNLWLSAARIAGKDNVDADKESRRINLDTEWMLNASLLKSALEVLQFNPDIDLFASRLNKQFTKYVSYRADPDALSLDSFTINWRGLKFYAFPPFSLISRVIQKVRKDEATGIIVAPFWPTQPFFPLLMKTLIQEPVLLSARVNLLFLPSSPDQKHPLHKKLRLLICKVSGKSTKVKAFQEKQPASSCPHGEMKQRKCTIDTLKTGSGTQLFNKWIQFHRL